MTLPTARHLARILLLSAILACSACTQLADFIRPAPPTQPANAGDAATQASEDALLALLNLTQQWRGRNGNDLAAELERLNRNYTNHKTEDSRLRLALFHAVTPKGDRNRALQLLDVSPGEGHGAGRNHPLAALLIPLLQERNRDDDPLAQAQLKLRDEQKRSELLQQKVDALQQKLDAIREIEKKMLERPAR